MRNDRLEGDGMRLSGKTCLITNAGDFMGPAIAAEFHREGARLAFQARDEASASQTLERHGVSLKETLGFIEADFAEPGMADLELAALVARRGPLDILINNNVGRNAGAIEDLTDEEWAEMVRRLVDEPMRTTRAAVRQMLEAGGGRIVTITSAGGVTPWSGVPMYSALRAFMVNLTNGLGKSLAPKGIYMKAIAQNAVVNPMYYPEEDRDSDVVRAEVKGLPIRRLAEGWESARLAAYLASEESDFLCAEVIKFAGGWG
jgi:NAD(P)-dependent dehydrogenase (short-subunit alcohol dehydrogenase family)